MTTDAYRNRAEVWGGGGVESTDNGRSHSFKERRKVAQLQIQRASRNEKKISRRYREIKRLSKNRAATRTGGEGNI